MLNGCENQKYKKPSGSVEKGQTNINYSQTKMQRKKHKSFSSLSFRWIVQAVSQSVSKLMMIIIMMRLLIIIYACCHFNEQMEEKCQVTLQFRSILLSVKSASKVVNCTRRTLNDIKYICKRCISLITMQICMNAREEVSKSLPQCLLVVWVDLVAHRNRKDTASSNASGMCCKNSLFTYM